jgi:hypothetical protein
MNQFARRLSFALVALFLLAPLAQAADQDWVVYEGKEGPGKGKSIVLISGDEEYRSEEVMPMLGRLLAERHGFKCTVLFAVNPKGEIDPNYGKNIPGLEALDSADLMIILTRFRTLPDDQMKHFDDFLKAGKPVIGLRTATHAFSGLKGQYEKYNWTYKGAEKEWTQGFGRLVLGETWINHHGGHMNDATRGLFAEGAKDSPLLNGIKDGEIWGPTDVYGVRLPMLPECKPLIMGQVLKRKGPSKSDKEDPFMGMSPEDQPAEGDKRNNPMMPVAWTKTYKLPDGKPGRSFDTTMGSSTDLVNEPLRRLLVNASYWLVDLKVPEKATVDIVGEYKPSSYKGNGFKEHMKPSDYAAK